jgi:4-diphosphocytidyl-2-C-methyl-D-erythritol kinase
MTSISLRSPAKINWTLDILGRRDDGYHEIRTVLQTIALSDTVTVSPADDISIIISGEAGDLVDQREEDNLAYMAASTLREASGTSAGAQIELHKRTPVAAGLGGGSSNAAAALRALRILWRLSLSDDDLTRLASRLGSDVPFFLTGGTALGSGRGDELTPLLDAPKLRLVLAWNATSRSNKTPEMYKALEPQDFGKDTATARLMKAVESGGALGDDHLNNNFEAVLPRVDSAAAQALADARAFGTPHLAGSGPALFFLLPPTAPSGQMISGLTKMGLNAIETHTITASEALEQL